MSIVKYNIDLEPADITHFMKKSKEKEQEKENNNEYLKLITNITAIPLERSITMFQDLNDIFIIFIEKTNKTHKNITRKYKK